MTMLQVHIDPIQVVRGELRVPYVISNPNDVAAYVYNLVADRFAVLASKPDPIPSAQLAQTCYDRDGIVLFVLGQVKRPMTPGAIQPSFFSQPKPLASRIEPGRALQATIRAKLPLLEWSEICVPERDAPELVDTAIVLAQIVAEYALEPDLINVREDASARGAFAISERMRHRAIADQDITALGVRMQVNPRAPRFA